MQFFSKGKNTVYKIGYSKVNKEADCNGNKGLHGSGRNVVYYTGKVCDGHLAYNTCPLNEVYNE